MKKHFLPSVALLLSLYGVTERVLAVLAARRDSVVQRLAVDRRRVLTGGANTSPVSAA
jgi:hypothetical protein